MTAVSVLPETASETAQLGVRAALGEFATGVCLITARADGLSRGMIVNSFTSVSLDPLLILVCIREHSEMGGLVLRGRQFALSVLAADQRPAAAWFADPRRPRGHRAFPGGRWLAGPVTRSPILSGSLAWLDCALERVIRAGDHDIVIARVLDLGHRPGARPLIFHAGAYHPSTAEPPGPRSA